MKLSTRARYAIRAMIQIARNSKEGQPVSLNVIAEQTSVSKRYLEQLVIPLKTAGLIRGISGKNGGYVLARPSDNIRIGEVVQAAIGPINIVNCVNEPDLCLKAELCECRPLYTLINEKIVDAMNEFSLADLADKNGGGEIDRDLFECLETDTDQEEQPGC